MLSKAERHFAIREIIGETAVASQDELRKLLKKRGADVTQATLSRDMREIGVIWVSAPGRGRYTLQLPEEAPLPRAPLENQVLSISANENMIVVHTLPGSAGIIAEFLDRQKYPGILGTVAGDNTLLVVPRTVRRTPEVLAFIKDTLIKGID